MKNNLRALLLHLVIVIISLIFLLIFVATGPKIGKLTTNVISRILFGVGFILAYIFSGTFLDRNTSKKYDFFVGSLIGVIGIFFWFYISSKTNIDLFKIIPKELSEHWVLMNIYYMPFTLVKFFFGLPNML